MAKGTKRGEPIPASSVRSALPRYARRLFDRLASVRDAKLKGSKADLLAALKKHKLPAHESVLRFDELFGGLLLQSEAVDDWREQGMVATVGAYACLASGRNRFPQKGLVPVMYDSRSGVEYLDAEGKAYVIDEIEEALTPFAPDGATMLAAIVAFDLLESHGERPTGFVEKPGHVGERVAKALGLTRVPLDCGGKLWVSDDVVVSEMEGTRIAAWSDEAWKKVDAILSRARRGAADLFEEAAKRAARAKESDENESLAPAFAALVAEIGGCTTLAELDKLFLPYSLNRATMDVVRDEQRDVSTALMKALRSMSVEESAKTLGWVAMHGGSRWAGLLPWTNEGHRRAAWCDGIEAELPVLRAWTKDASASRRTSAAYALGFCARAGAPEADALLAALAAEEDTGARGTELLALAAIARRSGARAVETKKLLAGEKPKPASFHAVATVAGRVFLDEPISAAEAEALLAQLRRAAKPPPEWAWTSSDGPTKCDRIAADAMNAMTLAEGAPVVGSLLKALHDPKLKKTAQEVKWALARAAFAGSGKETPREGIALEDLDERDVKVVNALLKGDRFTGEVHGLNNVALADMLAEKAPLWTLIDVTLKGKKHRWHFERIVGAVVFEGMSPEDACKAVLAGLGPKDAADVASSWSHARVALLANLKTADERARVIRTCLAILWAAKKKGVDVDALCAGASKRQLAEEGILSLWSMTDHEGQPPREHFALYKRAMARPEWPEALRDAFMSLPDAVRKDIEAMPP